MVSQRRVQQFTFGIALALASFVCSADKQEQWNVLVGSLKGIFRLNIQNNGNVTGTADFGPNNINKVEGTIKKNEINVIRRFSDTDIKIGQNWVGTYGPGGKTIKGTFTGIGGPGAWTADVVPPTPAPAPAVAPTPVPAPAAKPAPTAKPAAPAMPAVPAAPTAKPAAPVTPAAPAKPEKPAAPAVPAPAPAAKPLTK